VLLSFDMSKLPENALGRRSVAIESIEFIGSGQCVPILLGITGVMEW